VVRSSFEQLRLRRAAAQPAVAFVLAPFLMWAGSWLAVGIPVWVAEGFGSFGMLASVALHTLIDVGPWAYAAEAVVGIPAYVLITRRRALDARDCLWIGGAAGLGLGMLSPILDLSAVALTAILGAGTGFAFWMVYGLARRAARVTAG